MNCQRALEEIDLVLDDGENPGVELNEHLGACDACRRKFDSYKRIENRLRSAAARPEVAHETPARGLSVIERRTWRFRTLGLVAAACVMLLCAIYVANKPKEKEIVNQKEISPAVQPLQKPPEIKLPEKTVIVQAPQPTLEKLLSAPQNAFKSEGEKMLSDVRAVESFLLRCLPISRPENRG